MATVNVVNTRTTPYIVDEDGHLLAGGDSGPVDDSNDRVRRAIEAGIFLEIDQPAAVEPAAPKAAQSATSTPPADPAASEGNAS